MIIWKSGEYGICERTFHASSSASTNSRIPFKSHPTKNFSFLLKYVYEQTEIDKYEQREREKWTEIDDEPLDGAWEVRTTKSLLQ